MNAVIISVQDDKMSKEELADYARTIEEAVKGSAKACGLNKEPLPGLPCTAGSRYKHIKSQNEYTVVTGCGSGIGTLKRAALVDLSCFHSYTGMFHIVENWQDISLDELSAICGGHPENFKRLIK